MATRSRSPTSTTAWTSAAITDRQAKTLLFAVLSAPLAVLAWDVAGELHLPGSRLGADPGEAVVEFLGIWGIRVLLLTLCVSTLGRLLAVPGLVRFRRMTGLFAFTFLAGHFLAYLGFLAGFDWRAIQADLLERTYITAGFAALVLLAPLAVTSTRGWRVRLGRRWRSLHRAIYSATALGLAHYFWQTRDGFGEVALYAGLFALLMAERWWWSRRGARQAAPGAGMAIPTSGPRSPPPAR